LIPLPTCSNNGQPGEYRSRVPHPVTSNAVSSKQFVIQNQIESSANGLAPLGDRNELLQRLSHFNTAPDHEGGDTLYGPGIVLDLPPADEPLNQILLTVTEEEIGWLVIIKLLKEFRWSLIDTTTGNTLSPTVI
jgi:hypothetical protein